MKLNLGSGYAVEEGFLNIDASPFFKLALIPPLFLTLFGLGRYKERIDLFRQAKLRALLENKDVLRALEKIEVNSVSYIYSSHFFEHLSESDTHKLMKELERVAMPGCKFHIVVPNFGKLIEKYQKATSTGHSSAASDMLIAMDLPYINRSMKHKVYELFVGGLSHQQVFDKNALSALVKQYGFTEIASEESFPSDFETAYLNSVPDSLHLFSIKDNELD